MNMTCPHCGRPISVHIGKVHPKLGPGWDYGRSSHFETTGPFNQSLAATDYYGPMEAVRQSPARPATIESDVKVPLLQSLATGAAVAILAIAPTVWLEWAWYTPLLTGSVAVTMTWFSLLGSHRKLLWIIESVSNLVDNEPATPVRQSVSLEVKHQEATGRIGRMQFVDLPETITREQLLEWAGAVANGVKTPARSNWAGNGLPFSRDQYDAFTAAMVEAGILHDIPGKGKQLTTGGKHALKHLITTEN